MKRILFGLLFFPLCGCESLRTAINDPNSAVSQLGTQALSIGLSKVTGRSVSANGIEGAAALLRSLAGAKKPTTQAIQASRLWMVPDSRSGTKIRTFLAHWCSRISFRKARQTGGRL